MTSEHLYAERDAISQGRHYTKHVEAMTAEALHSKSDIAAELAHRDIEIERLERCLSIANSNHEKFEREWYLRGDRIEELERELVEARALMYRWTLYECGDESLPTDTLYRETYDALGLPANMQAMKSAVGITDKPADQPEGER